MKKHTYIAPRCRVTRVENFNIIATSSGGTIPSGEIESIPNGELVGFGEGTTYYD